MRGVHMHEVVAWRQTAVNPPQPHNDKATVPALLQGRFSLESVQVANDMLPAELYHSTQNLLSQTTRT